MIATGITAQGQREILSFHIDDSESEASWREFFDRLKQRGLSGVDLIVSDCHGGLVQSIRTHFQGFFGSVAKLTSCVISSMRLPSL